jgi:hypothetical protein
MCNTFDISDLIIVFPSNHATTSEVDIELSGRRYMTGPAAQVSVHAVDSANCYQGGYRVMQFQ